MTACQLTWQTLGAQVLRVNTGGTELLYLSPWFDPKAQRAARGGVPVLFPQFADRGPFKKHGWARDVEWVLTQIASGADSHVLEWEWVCGGTNQPLWPHQAHLRLRAQATASGLKIQLDVCNTGTSTFEWTGGLHPYWAVGNLLESQLKGLQGVSVSDRYNASRIIEAREAVQWSGQAYESLYDMPDPVSLELPSHTLKLSMTGFDQWMVWNPGADEAKNLNDMPAADWQRFVCIEPVRVSRPCRLQPGDSFTGKLKAEWWPNSDGMGRR
mgnify:CR=1 FL=1